MLIALDFDGTYTQDPDLWNNFIMNARLRDHRVICVTMRSVDEGDIVYNSIGKFCDVIFTNRKAKEKYLNNMGIYPDLWIDDNPLWIYNNA